MLQNPESTRWVHFTVDVINTHRPINMTSRKIAKKIREGFGLPDSSVTVVQGGQLHNRIPSPNRNSFKLSIKSKRMGFTPGEIQEMIFYIDDSSHIIVRKYDKQIDG